MHKDQREILERLIRQKIAALKQDILAYAQMTQPVAPDSAIGRLTRTEAMHSRGINEAALCKAKNALVCLERTLVRIDHPDFGLCSACEEPIPMERLMVLPESDLCVECAQKMAG